MLRWLIGRPDEDEVRLPVLRDHHESSVRGLHIVGDLAGAPTIRVAANQGHDVMHHIASLPDGRSERASDVLDVIIVGGGSSGIAAALEAAGCGLRARVLESGCLANTIREFPKRKPIYAEPKAVESRSRLWIEDSVKEDLLERWDRDLEGAGLDVREGAEVTEIRRRQGAFDVVTATGEVHRGRRVVLAIGKRGNPRKLGVPGEDRPEVRYRLYDPDDHRGERVLVVGGGDTAVEAALALSEVADVKISYRRDAFFRLKTKNLERIDAALREGRLEVVFGSEVREIREGETVLGTREGDRTVPVDGVIVAIGAELPHGFFRRTGIRMEKEWSAGKIGLLLLVTAVFYLAYAAKKGPETFPLGLLGLTWDDLRLGRFQWWEWFTFAYSAAVLVFGVRAFRKYRYSTLQRWKYASVIFFQVFVLCVFPIFLVPRLAPEWYANAGYAFHLVLAWPLSIQAIPAPWHAGHLVPFLYAVGLTFVAIPLFVYFLGSRFCSWVCGCGCLAETLGDEVRHLAPRGPKSIRFERRAATAVLGIAAAVTLASLFFSSWVLASEGMALYALWVDTVLAGAIGVGFYGFLGNRVWCRFFCPLRMYMNLIGRVASRFRIVPTPDKCIACGQCSRECQMGIPVMDFAKAAEPVTLRNSSCIGCGICVDVCPVDVLHYSERAAAAAAPEKT